MRQLQAGRRFRQRERAFVVEGSRWLKELYSHSQSATMIFYTGQWLNGAHNRPLLESISGNKYEVAEPIMATMSTMQSPPGVLAVMPMPALALATESSLFVILDGIRNPGNLGALLRTADAAGVDGLLLAPGCVDPFNPKVVHGGMGSHLRLPLWQMSWEEVAAVVQGFQVWVGAAAGGISYDQVEWRQPSALLIGAEAAGASAAGLKLASGAVSVPMREGPESLNAAVAAGILLFEARRQRRRPSNGD